MRTANARCEIDTTKVVWYDAFFAAHGEPIESLFKTLEAIDVDVDEAARSEDLGHWGLSGSSYWLLYIKGYLQYEATGAIDSQNVYYDYMTRYGQQHRHDPGLSRSLTDLASARSRILRRFEDFRFFRHRIAAARELASCVASVTFVVQSEPASDTKMVYLVGSDVPIPATTLDGYHRLFLACLFGVPTLPCEITYVSPVPEDGAGPPS